MVGLSWNKGGAQRFADYCEFDGPEARWWSLDVSKKDMAFKCYDLTMNIGKSDNMFDRSLSSPVDVFIYETYLNYLLTNTVFKMMCIDKEYWVKIYGLLASGDYNTSNANTEHMVIYWEKYLSSTLTKDEYKKAIVDYWLRTLFQGDDGLIRIPLVPSFYGKLTLEGFDIFLKTQSAALKWSQSGEFLSPYSIIDPIRGYVITKGPVFLKRYFFKNSEGKCETFRSIEDYIFKSVTTSSDVSDIEVYLDVISGLMIDTHGTNLLAYKFLRRMGVEAMLYESYRPRARPMLENRRYKKHGIEKEDYESLEFDSLYFPTQKSIRKLFQTLDIKHCPFIPQERHRKENRPLY